MIRGVRVRRAVSTAREIFSPTTDPMLPPMKRKSMTASTIGRVSSVAVPTMTASLRPVFCMAFFRRSTYRSESRNFNGSAERMFPNSSLKEPSSQIKEM